jgi:antitoxin PrlF
MASARLNSKGEITLPKSFPERLGLKAGNQVEFVPVRSGAVLLRFIAHDIRMLKGIVRKPDETRLRRVINLAIRKMGRP